MKEQELLQIPKVDLHVHLEGSITPKTLNQIARFRNSELPPGILTADREQYDFSSHEGFFRIYPVINGFLHTPDALEFATRSFLRDQAAQNIVYSEVIFTPLLDLPDFSFDAQYQAIHRGYQAGLREFGADMALIVDVSREQPLDRVNRVVEWAIQAHQASSADTSFLIGFGIGGIEARGLPPKFTDVGHSLNQAGLKFFPHAGEQLGPAIIWDTLRLLHPDRIGHGIRCIEDPLLVETLRTSQIPLDVSPLSNIALGYYPSLDKHPLSAMIAAGLNISLNSDDPGLMNFTFNDQILKISHELGYRDATIYTLIRNGVRNSCLKQDTKNALCTKIDEVQFTWNSGGI